MEIIWKSKKKKKTLEYTKQLYKLTYYIDTSI